MSVRLFTSADGSAPVVNGTAGSLVNLLKKCLVDGYGAKTPPGGWECVASGNGQKAAFRSNAAGSSQIWLHADDSAPSTARFARCRAWETLSGLDANGDPASGSSGQFPTVAQQATCGVMKSATADTLSRPWVLVADSQAFYLAIDWVSHGAKYDLLFFGDALSLRANDVYGCMVAMNTNEAASSPETSSGHSRMNELMTSTNALQTTHWLARRYDQTGAAVNAGKWGDYLCANVATGTPRLGTGGFVYPNPADNSLLVAPIGLLEAGPTARGMMPGLYQPLHNGAVDTHVTIDSPAGLPGRTLFNLKTACTAAGNTSHVMFDVTGPWR